MYRTCDKTPMHIFVQCLITDKYDSLVIAGTATAEEKEQAWLVLLSEYLELKGEEYTQDEHWLISCQIIRLQHHLFILQTCLDVLNERYSDSIAKSVRLLGYKFKTSSVYPADYRNQLYNIAEQAKSKVIEIEQLTIKLKKILSDAEKNKSKPTVALFQGKLIAFEEMQKTTYDFDTISVSKFVALEQKYNRHIALLSAKTMKHARS